MLKAIFVRVIIIAISTFLAFDLLAQEVDTAYYDTGEILSIGALDSKNREIGNWVYFWVNGLKNHEGYYVKGKMDGEWVYYTIDGTLQEVMLYHNGILIVNETSEIEKLSLESVESFPEFPNGENALMQFLGSSIQYPKKARKSGIEGEVIVSFTIWEDGSLKDVVIVKSVHPLIDAEVIRVVKSMPKWKPGMQDGKSVRVQYNLPINFRLPKN